MTPERRYFVLSIALPPLILAAFFVGYLARPQVAVGEGMETVGESCALVYQYYHGDLKEGQLREGAIRGMLRTLDRYSAYFTPEEWAEFNNMELEGKFGGIGVIVNADPDYRCILVVATLPEGPARAAGILPKDRITAVDGVSLRDEDFQHAVRRVRGEPGTPVVLTVWREGQDPFDVTVKRAAIEVPAVHAKMIDAKNGIGYIRVVKFQKLMDEFDEKYAALEEQGLKALIVDLRFNTGGLYRECVALSDRFLDSGTIVTTRGRGSSAELREEAKAGETRVRVRPLVLLVNGDTASASEIFAGAIRDHGRGVLVGARTYGKGLVQTPFPLSDGARLKITTAEYFTPKGTKVNRV
ncbi:MAG: S41 family peptidase, partial [Planctomycetota bacterium]